MTMRLLVIPREGVERLTDRNPHYLHVNYRRVIPREGVESIAFVSGNVKMSAWIVIPREGVESNRQYQRF